MTDPYDPGAHTVAEVTAYIAEHPDEEEAILAAEAAGKNRTTLVGEIGEGDGDDEDVCPVCGRKGRAPGHH